MSKFRFALIIFVGLLFMSSQALAAQFLHPSIKDRDQVSTSPKDQHKDLYTATENVTLEGQVQGDLFAAGANVTLIGPVEKDAHITAGTAKLSGRIGDDLRILGGDVVVDSFVSGDLLVAGGRVLLTDQAMVNGDLVVVGGSVIVNGPVLGKVKIKAKDVTLNSQVTGSVKVLSKEQLVFGPQAHIASMIDYSGPKEARVAPSAVVSTINYTKVSHFIGTKAFLGFGIVVDTLAVLLAALVVWALARNRIRLGIRGAKDKPWLSLGIGVLGVIVTPAIVIILFATVVGYYLALITLLWYLLLLLVGFLSGTFIFGSLVLMVISKASDPPLTWISVVVGVVLTKAIILIPWVGWIVVLLFTLLGIGTMLRMTKYEIKRNRE